MGVHVAGVRVASGRDVLRDVALVAGIVFIIGLIVAFVWPPTYEASATILIEEQEIPVELITATVTSWNWMATSRRRKK